MNRGSAIGGGRRCDLSRRAKYQVREKRVEPAAGNAMISRFFGKFLLTAALLSLAGCTHSVPARDHETAYQFWALVDPDSQRRIVEGHYDRARLRKEVGPPTIDDGEEWVYVGKYEDTGGLDAGMLMAVTASLDDPTWKTVVVTFDPKGIVERIRVGTTESAIAEQQKRGILFGVYYDRAGRIRSATRPTTRRGGAAN
jgi:hypothetical protein